MTLTVTTLVYAFSTSFWMLVFARTLQGLAAAIPWTAGLAMLAEVFPEKERGQAMGIAMSGQAGGILLGPPAGGWLYEWGGYSAPFLIAAAVALLSALLCVLFLRHIKENQSAYFTSPFKILHNKQVLLISGAAVIGASAFASVEPTLPIHLNADLHLSPGMIGSVFVVLTLAYGGTSPMIGTLSTRIGHIKTIIIGVVTAAIALPLNALPDQVWLQLITIALLGIALGMILTPALPELASLSQRISGVSLGITFAVYNTAYSFGMMIGPLIAGTLTDRFNLLSAYVTISVLFLVYLIPLYRLDRLDR